MKNLSYIGLIIILIVFGLLFIPKIVDRVANNTQVESNRSVPAKPLAYIKLNGEAKKVPEFLMRNQDSLLIGNEDFSGKVYLAEFFFTRCPTICPIMNKNMNSRVGPVATAAAIARTFGRSVAAQEFLSAFGQAVPQSWQLEAEQEKHKCVGSMLTLGGWR